MLVHTKRPRHPAQAPGMRKHFKNGASEESLAKAPARDPFHSRPGRLQKRVVLHARRARRDARHAPKTRIDMFDEALRVRLPAIAVQFHQVNASAWRVRLLPPQQIRRAGGKTEAAVNAIVEKFASRSGHRSDYIRSMVLGAELGCAVARWISVAQQLRTLQP